MVCTGGRVAVDGVHGDKGTGGFPTLKVGCRTPKIVGQPAFAEISLLEIDKTQKLKPMRLRAWGTEHSFNDM